MRTLGVSVLIDPQYREATSPVVRVLVLYRADFDPAEYYRRLATFANYLVKDGKGGDDPEEHFGPGAVDVPGFLAQAWCTPHNFMIMPCPDTVHGHQLPLQEFTEVWMQQVQADLGVPLMWRGSVHRDTDSGYRGFSGDEMKCAVSSTPYHLPYNQEAIGVFILTRGATHPSITRGSRPLCPISGI